MFSNEPEEREQLPVLFFYPRFLSENKETKVQIPVLGNAHDKAGELSKETLVLNVPSAVG